MLEKIFGNKDDLDKTLNQLNNVINRLNVIEQDCNNAIEADDLDRAREYVSKIAVLYDEYNELALKYLVFLDAKQNPQHALGEVESLQETIRNTETFFKTFDIDIDDIKVNNFMRTEFFKAKFLFNLQKYRRSLKSLDSLLELNDSSDLFWTYKGKVLFALERFSESLDAYERAIEADWHTADAWIGKGQILNASQNFSEALEAFDTALEIEENNVEANEGRETALAGLNGKGQKLTKQNDSQKFTDSSDTDEPNDFEKHSNQSIPKTGNQNIAQKSERKVFQKPAEKKADSRPKGFESVAGMLELKELLTRDVIKPLKNPEKYKKFNVTIPNGILLYGPPGCGKTFIVEKLAEEVGYNFIVVPPSKIGSKYIHETSDNIAKIFTEAKDNSPTILFFDEFEALVPRRESLGSEGQSKTEEINEFLTHLNNASNLGILVVGATNQPDLIDRAVMRAGRIDKVILVPPPDAEARKELFRSKLSKVPHSNDIDFGKLAEKTEYYSSSDITTIIDSAGRIAGDQDLDEINEDLMEHVIENSKPSISKSQIESYKAFSNLERK